MSFNCIAILLLPICALAQSIWTDDGIAPNGEMRGANPGEPGTRSFERYEPDLFGGMARAASRFDDRLDMEPVNPDSSNTRNRPISGLVSVKQLQHRPSQKAIRLLMEAHRLSEAHDTGRATEKLQEAVRLDPSFREAHLNLGVQYARADRIAHAMAEFEKALEIGPPDAKAYSNLAYCYLRLGALEDAEDAARAALKLDPANAPARNLYGVAAEARHRLPAR